ncbi:hypothetical protein VTI28DRAFT_7271 [Corynascus sepedonium]
MRSHLVSGLLLGVLPWTAVALMGLGQQMYYPACGYACLNTLSTFPLSCTTHDHHDMGGDMSDMEMDMPSMATTTPACRAEDRAYLTTLAWCFHTKCTDDAVPDWDLEKFWAEQATTDPTVAPKWSYSAALANISRPPTKELAADDTLNVTALVPQDAWTSEYGTMTTMEFVEAWHERYGLIIVLVGFGTPILFTALRHLPYMNRLLDRLNPYLVYPAIWGGRQVRPLPYNLGNAPTVGQALYVAVLVVLNVVMTAVSYRSFQPSVWYADQYQEVMVWVMYRTGVLAFALLPLTLLLAGRNNVLLWLSDWSHATYVLLHRWVARLFALQALLHSLLALVLYDRTGLYAGETSKPWWVWGAVATVAASVMLVASGLYVRRWSYEIFLISHVLLAVFVIVGCWYHIDLRFMRMFGYEQWLYAACAVWFFDRLIRFLRVLKAGVRRAKVTEIGEEFVRVDIEGVRWGTTPGQHAYIYFPTLNPLRPWENHPFSLLPSSILSPPSKHSSSTESASSDAEADHDPEKAIAADPEKMAIAPVTSTTAANKTTTPAAASVPTPAGITFFIRKSGDLTRRLRSHASLLALLDGPYPNNSTASALRCDRVLLVAGGIGITGVLPWARSSGHPNTRLCWSVRTEAEHLVDALSPAIEAVPDRVVRVGGRRFDVRALVEDEVRAGWRRIGVVVCGPGSLCDEMRAVVAEIGRREACNGVVLELEVDAYSW